MLHFVLKKDFCRSVVQHSDRWSQYQEEILYVRSSATGGGNSQHRGKHCQPWSEMTQSYENTGLHPLQRPSGIQKGPQQTHQVYFQTQQAERSNSCFGHFK